MISQYYTQVLPLLIREQYGIDSSKILISKEHEWIPIN